jgi:hypothetical protein
MKVPCADCTHKKVCAMSRETLCHMRDEYDSRLRNYGVEIAVACENFKQKITFKEE